MGTNCGSVLVRLPKGTNLAGLMGRIQESYSRRGARKVSHTYRADLEPLTLSDPLRKKKAGVLGVAVSPEKNGWITIVDSERYTGDSALARDLAADLGTTTFWVFTGDVSNSYLVCRFGEPNDWSEVPNDFQNEYYDQLADNEREGWSFLTVEALPCDSYEAYPQEIPQAKLTCEFCEEEYVWRVGEEMTGLTPSITIDLDDSESLLAESPDRISANTPLLRLGRGHGHTRKILVAVPCPRCSRTDGAWTEAIWDRGVIVQCRALEGKPKSLRGYAFQFGPFAQTVQEPSGGAARIGYMTSQSATAPPGPLGDVVVDQSFETVLATFIADCNAKALLVVGGSKLAGANLHVDDMTDPVKLRDASIKGRYDRPTVFEAWMRGLLLRTGDPVGAEAVLQQSALSDWPKLHKQFDGMAPSVAENTRAELDRAAGALARSAEYERTSKELFEAAASDDQAAARMLELAAVRERNFMMWRFARAVADGKSTAAGFYKGRVKVS